MGHVTCCWQEVAACPAAGTETCTLTFGDIITLPIRGLLSFVSSDELVRISTWDGGGVQTGPHLGPRQTSITLCYSCWILIHCILPSHSMGTWCPQLEPGLVLSICTHLKHFIICCLSLWKLCCRGTKPNSANDRCCGQRCVQFSSLVSGVLSPGAPALHIRISLVLPLNGLHPFFIL